MGVAQDKRAVSGSKSTADPKTQSTRKAFRWKQPTCSALVPLPMPLLLLAAWPLVQTSLVQRMTKVLSTEQWERKTSKEAQETVATTQKHAQPSHATPTRMMKQGSNNNKGCHQAWQYESGPQTVHAFELLADCPSTQAAAAAHSHACEC